METLSFPRYNVAEIVTHVRNKILTGADGKNLSKSDLYPNPKVSAEAGRAWRPDTGSGLGQWFQCAGPARSCTSARGRLLHGRCLREEKASRPQTR